jgi:hypothetical protein
LLLALCSLPVAAHEEEGASVTPDFRFKQPWVIIGMRGGWAFNRSDSEI